ncbi:unnamed protein product, partial [Vitis vinifera]
MSSKKTSIITPHNDMLYNSLLVSNTNFLQCVISTLKST